MNPLGTVAWLRAALARRRYTAPDTLPVAVSAPDSTSAHLITTRIQFGHLTPATAPGWNGTAGRITRHGDGPAVAALTVRPAPADYADMDRAPSAATLARMLAAAEHVDPHLPLAVPLIGSDGLYAPLHHLFGIEPYDYDPDAADQCNVWGLEPGDGAEVLALWPAPDFPATAPADWFRRLTQGRTWTGADDRTRWITDMTRAEVLEALATLEDKAEWIAEQVTRALVTTPSAAMSVDRPAGTRTLMQECGMAAADPRGWIAQTPLAQALAFHAS